MNKGIREGSSPSRSEIIMQTEPHYPGSNRMMINMQEVLGVCRGHDAFCFKHQENGIDIFYEFRKIEGIEPVFHAFFFCNLLVSQTSEDKGAFLLLSIITKSTPIQE